MGRARQSAGILGWVAAVIGCAKTTAQETQRIDLGRPDYTQLRQDEDWSRLTLRDDPWDVLKHITLDEDLDIHLTIGGSARLRGEFLTDRTFGSPNDDDQVLLWRIRAHGDLQFTQFARVFVEGEHASTTKREGPDDRLDADIEGLGLFQRFVDLVPFREAESEVGARLGRQTFAFGSERLVSPDSWTNGGNSWEAATLRARSNEFEFHGFWGQAVERVPYEENQADADEQFFGAHGTIRNPEGRAGVEAYYLARLQNDVTLAGVTGREERHTLGGRWYREPGSGFDWDVEAAWQFGQLSGSDLQAWMVAAEGGLPLGGEDGWDTARVYGGLQIATGDDGPGGDIGTFDPLYPDTHRHLGLVDLIGQQNVMAAWIGLTQETAASWAFDAKALSFWRENLGDSVYDAQGVVVRAPSGRGSRHIGVELDVTARLPLDRHATLEIGWGRLFAGDFLDDTGTDRDSERWYASVQYVF